MPARNAVLETSTCALAKIDGGIESRRAGVGECSVSICVETYKRRLIHFIICQHWCVDIEVCCTLLNKGKR